MTSSNGTFKGTTTARLDRIEADIKELKSDVKFLRDNQMRFLGVIGVGAFLLPILFKFLP